MTGATPTTIPGAVRVGGWWVAEPLHASATAAVTSMLERFHATNPLLEGADLAATRAAAADALDASARGAPSGLADSLLDDLVARGTIARTGSAVRLASHRVVLDQRREEVDRLVEEVMNASPKTISPDTLVGEALAMMNTADRPFTVLFVVEDRRPIGIVHMHDFLRLGVA